MKKIIIISCAVMGVMNAPCDASGKHKSPFPNGCWVTKTQTCSWAAAPTNNFIYMNYSNPCDGSFDSFESTGGVCDLDTVCNKVPDACGNTSVVHK